MSYVVETSRQFQALKEAKICTFSGDYVSFMQIPVHLSFGRVKTLWTGSNISGQVQNKEQERSSKIRDIVSYALKMGVTCVFVVSTKNMSTGTNIILHTTLVL